MSQVNEVKCSEPGCKNVFRSVEPFHPNVKFTCREHTGKDAKKAPVFQRYAHDRDLGASSSKKQVYDGVVHNS